MAVIASQVAPFSGAALTYSAASGGGDRFMPGDFTVIHVKNGGGSPVTMTLVTPNTDPTGNLIADRVVTVAATSDRIVKVPTSVFASADGLGDITWSGVTSVTLAVVNV